MKNTYKLLVAFVAILGFWSCDNETDLMILEPQEADFAIITPDAGSKVILNKATPDNTALTLTWEKVSYGTPTIVTYTVEFAKSGTDFAAPVEINATSNSFATIKVSELNTKALDFGLTPEVEGTIDIRIKSTVGTTGSQPKYSKAISIVVTPYRGVFPKVDLYQVGPATIAGWDVNKGNMPIFRDTKDNAKFYYTGYFNAGGFKLIEQLGFWAPSYGVDGDKVKYRANDSAPDPAVFPTDKAGYYYFELNLESLTYTLTPYTGPMTTYATVGLVGDALPSGWDVSVPMVQSTFDAHMWKITQTLTDGKMKFRANNSWDVNWGDNGGDIIVTAGKYDIWFNDLDGRYTFIVVQ